VWGGLRDRRGCMGVDKMDAEGNSQEGNWKFIRRRDWGGG